MRRVRCKLEEQSALPCLVCERMECTVRVGEHSHRFIQARTQIHKFNYYKIYSRREKKMPKWHSVYTNTHTHTHKEHMYDSSIFWSERQVGVCKSRKRMRMAWNYQILQEVCNLILSSRCCRWSDVVLYRFLEFAKFFERCWYHFEG